MDTSPVHQVLPKPFAIDSERGKKTKQTEKEMGKQYQGMDRQALSSPSPRENSFLQEILLILCVCLYVNVFVCVCVCVCLSFSLCVCVVYASVCLCACRCLRARMGTCVCAEVLLVLWFLLAYPSLDTETCMVRAYHTPRQTLQNHPSGHLGGWATPWSAEEKLDGQHQRMDIPAQARIAHNGLLHKRGPLLNCPSCPPDDPVGQGTELN